jgi:hypothetical protein
MSSFSAHHQFFLRICANKKERKKEDRKQKNEVCLLEWDPGPSERLTLTESRLVRQKLCIHVAYSIWQHGNLASDP